MKVLGVFLLSLLGSSLLLYLLGSFTVLSFNPALWEMSLRCMGGFMAVVLAVVLTLCICGDD